MGYPHNDKDREAQQNRQGGGYDYRNEQQPQGQQRGNDRGDPREEEDNAPLTPDGDYPVVAIAYKWGFAGGEKYEQIGIRLRVTDGPLKGKTLLYYGGFHPNSEEFTTKALKALGIYDLIWNKASDVLTVDTPAIAVVKQETYQGKVRSKVQWINGADVVMKNEMNDNDLRAFAARMRGNRTRNGGNTQPAQQPRGNSQPQGQQRSFGDRQQPQSRGQADDDRPPFEDGDAPPPRYNR